MATIPSISLIPSGYKAGKVYSVLPTDGSGDLTFARASTATRINKNNLIENVGNNVPRLDYEGGGCPSLLLEGNSTNLITQSELFSNSYWTKSGATVTSGFSAPSLDSPLGAFKLVEDTSNGEHRTEAVSADATNGTHSFFVKADTRQWVAIYDPILGKGKYFDLLNGVVGGNYNSAPDNATIESISDNWYRISISTTGLGRSRLILSESGTDTNYQGDGTSGVYIFGAQLEQKSHATSYIPTSGSQITRLAETANGSGNASTFNDSEGVLFFEASTLLNGGTYMTISINDGTSSNDISLLYRIQENEVWMQTSGSGSDTNINIYDVVQNENNKIALSYSSNGIKIFVNGILKGSIAINALPIGLNSVEFNNGAQGENFYGNVKDLKVYKTALTSLEIQTLTSYSSFNAMALNFNYKIQ